MAKSRGRSAELSQRMIERSRDAMPTALPIANAGIETPVSALDARSIVRRIESGLLEADGHASQIMNNVDGAINRAVASATVARSQLANSMQAPLTMSVNESGKRYAEVSKAVSTGIDRSIGEIVGLQAANFAPLALPVEAFAEKGLSDEAFAVAQQVANDTGVSIESAAEVVRQMSPQQLQAFVGSGRAERYGTELDDVQPSIPAQPAQPTIPLSVQNAGFNTQSALPNTYPSSVTGKLTIRQWAYQMWNPDSHLFTYIPGNDYANYLAQRAVYAERGQIAWEALGATPPNPQIGSSAILGVMAAWGAPQYHQFDCAQVICNERLIIGLKNPQTLPVPTPLPPSTPAPSPTPPSPPSPSPSPVPPGCPQPPAEQPCIKLCESECKEPEEPDLCKLCNGIMFFNTDDCTIAVFEEGCGPNREEKQWVELGKTTDKDQVEALIAEHCDDTQQDDAPRVPPGAPQPRQPGVTPQQLCNFIPRAASITEFYTGGIVLAALASLRARLLSAGFFPGATFVIAAIEALIQATHYSSHTVSLFIDLILRSVLGANGCGDARIVGIYTLLAVVGFIERWLVSDLGDLKLPLIQQARYACPVGIPSASEATAAVLADTMGDDEWRCIVRANNLSDTQYEKVALAMRRKLEPVQLIILRAREVISQQQYADRMRQLGFVRDDSAEMAWKASEWIPGPSDIVRFMLRDAGDEAVVRQFGLDDEFANKYSAQLRDFAKGQRVDDSVMRLYWRAHWNIPSPTQLFEFYRRFRNRTDLWPTGNPDADVRAALVQQDILPRWINAFLATTFHPLGRVDARRLLELGVINESEAIDAWKELGYSDENASRLVKLAFAVAQKQAVKHSVVKRFANGELSSAEAAAILDMESVPERFKSLIMQRADLEANAARRKECVKGIERRYMLGEWTLQDLTVQLMNQGVETQTAQQLATRMECKRSSRGKTVAAQTLTKWYLDNIISGSDFVIRLLRVGYSQDDTIRMLRYANLQLDRKLSREEQREIAKAKAEAKEADAKKRREVADRRQADADRRRQERERDAAVRRLESALKETTKQAEQRRDKLAALYTDVERKFETTAAEAVAMTDRLYLRFDGHVLATSNEILSAMAESLVMQDSVDEVSWTAAASAVLSSRVGASPL